jgi:hypothetical protein
MRTGNGLARRTYLDLKRQCPEAVPACLPPPPPRFFVQTTNCYREEWTTPDITDGTIRHDDRFELYEHWIRARFASPV